MENASKALIMAATVLLGIMLISIGVYLFSIFGGFSSQIANTLSEKEINEFNTKFYKYESYKDSNKKWQNLCRAQDIVTVAYLAKDNNIKYEYTDNDKNNKNASYYITVNIDHKILFNNNSLILNNTEKRLSSAIRPIGATKNFEQKSEEFYTAFMKQYSLMPDTAEPIYYRCRVTINSDTKLVKVITFTPIAN